MQNAHMRTDANLADIDTARRNENGIRRSSDVRGGQAVTWARNDSLQLQKHESSLVVSYMSATICDGFNQNITDKIWTRFL